MTPAPSDERLRDQIDRLKRGYFPPAIPELVAVYEELLERRSVTSQASDGADRVAWLIERKGFAGDPRPHWYWEDALGHHAWTPEATAALPFKTKAEAEAFPAYRMISRDPEIMVTEHMFMASAAPQSKRVERLEAALKPFSDYAGELFARNWNASYVVLALDNPDDPHRVTGADFFAARQALQGGRS